MGGEAGKAADRVAQCGGRLLGSSPRMLVLTAVVTG